MSNLDTQPVTVLEPFSGRLNWIACRPRGNTFGHALRCKQAITWSLSNRIAAFCEERFGKPGPGGRWFMHYEYVAFRTEADMMLFLLKWQGQI